MYRIGAAAGAALTLVAGTAMAQDDNTEGLYVGAGYGDFSAEIEELDDIPDTVLDFDEDESAFKVFAGWRFNKFLAIQGDYYDFGDSTAALNELPLAARTDGIAPSIVGTLPIGFVELFARAGIVYYDLEVNLDLDNVIDESGNDPVYSAGIGFTLFQRLNLELEYEVIDIDEFDEADAVWISASWRF
jgi:hypothetical protein